MEFIVSLETFDGPLDLMLHLVKEQKLDLMNLDMSALADQYISYLHTMQDLHLDIASEYLEELASLLEYKSRKLLPRFEDQEPDAYEQDQRDQLVSRLLEYQKYKEAALALDQRMNERSHQLGRPQAGIIEEWQNGQECFDQAHYASSLLVKAMVRSLRRHALLNPYQTQISVRQISIEEKTAQILARSDLPEIFTFAALCADAASLHEVIVTFLAVLAAIHEQSLLLVEVKEPEIWLKKGRTNA